MKSGIMSNRKLEDERKWKLKKIMKEEKRVKQLSGAAEKSGESFSELFA